MWVKARIIYLGKNNTSKENCCASCPPTKAQLGRFIPTAKTQKSLVNCPHSRALICGSTKILYGNETKQNTPKERGRDNSKRKIWEFNESLFLCRHGKLLRD